MLTVPHDHRFDVAADAVAEMLDALPDGTALVVDLDETLWLRNSTEEYLASMRPRWLVGFVLVVIEIARPWRVFGRREHAADWFRVVACTVLFPWSIVLWRRKVRGLGPANANAPLAALLGSRTGSPLVVATLGFGPVAGPLTRSLGLPEHELVTCRFWLGWRDRARGKAAMVRERMPDALDGAAVVTDSATDWDLLSCCAHPMLVVWPEARYEPAPRGYVPFAYTEMQKRSGDNYVRHIVVQRDFVLWVLATVFVTDISLARHLPGLAFLLLSFWCIYELGYIENDELGQRHEDDPVLPDGYAGPPPRAHLAAWTWALATGTIAVVLLRPGTLLVGLGGWLAFLLGVRVSYALYNRLDKEARPLLYVVLQAARMAAPLVLVPVAVVGVLALLMVVWSRSILYVLYRVAGGPWRDISLDLYNALLLPLAVLGLAVAGAPIEAIEAAALLTWFVWTARSEVRRALPTLRAVWRRDEPGSSQPSSAGVELE